MKLKIVFVVFVLTVAAGIGGVTPANSGNACIYEPEPPCTTCS
jgi:hypothetical protein